MKFNLSVWHTELVLPELCIWFEIYHKFTSGPDRIDNDVGYEHLNVLPFCTDCNMARGTASIRDNLLRLKGEGMIDNEKEEEIIKNIENFHARMKIIYDQRGGLQSSYVLMWSDYIKKYENGEKITVSSFLFESTWP